MQKDKWDVAGRMSGQRHGVGVIFENGMFNIHGGRIQRVESPGDCHYSVSHDYIVDGSIDVTQSMECQFESYWNATDKQR